MVCELGHDERDVESTIASGCESTIMPTCGTDMIGDRVYVDTDCGTRSTGSAKLCATKSMQYV